MEMLKTRFAAIICTLIFMLPAMANAEYQSEIFIELDSYDYEGNIEGSFNQLNYKYYLDKVSTNNVPLAEAAFLGRVSNIEVGWYNFSFDYPDNDTADGDGLGFIYSHKQKNSPLNLEVLYDSSSMAFTDQAGPNDYDLDILSYGIIIGWFIEDTTTVNFEYIKIDYDYSAVFADETEEHTLISFKKVEKLGGNTAYNLEAMIGTVDYEGNSNTQLGIQGDYYLDNMKSIGAEYLSESGDSKADEGTTTVIRGQIFFNKQFSLRAQLESYDADNPSGTSYDETVIAVHYRF